MRSKIKEDAMENGIYKIQLNNWDKVYGKSLTEIEHKEIFKNLNGFFTILWEWNNKNAREIRN